MPGRVWRLRHTGRGRAGLGRPGWRRGVLGSPGPRTRGCCLAFVFVLKKKEGEEKRGENEEKERGGVRKWRSEGVAMEQKKTKKNKCLAVFYTRNLVEHPSHAEDRIVPECRVKQDWSTISQLCHGPYLLSFFFFHFYSFFFLNCRHHVT